MEVIAVGSECSTGEVETKVGEGKRRASGKVYVYVFRRVASGQGDFDSEEEEEEEGGIYVGGEKKKGEKRSTRMICNGGEGRKKKEGWTKSDTKRNPWRIA